MKKIFLIVLLFVLAGCKFNDKEIKVGASSTPHALILEQAREYIESKGYKLKIVVFDDYVLPNLSLENGELDANYFQHQPYLDEFNKENGTHIKSVFKVHFEPMGIYAGRKNNLNDYQKGDKIIVPSDKSNYDRALELIKDLEEPTIIMVEAQSIPLMLSDCDYAVINGNYALASNVLDKCLKTEAKDSEIALRLANIIAVTDETDKIKILVKALKQPNIEQYIKETFGNSVIFVGAE